MKSLKHLLPLVMALPLLLGSMTAGAVPIKTALGISIDSSGSIGSADFAVQRSAYASVFGDASIVKADGSVVVNVIQFSSTASVIQTAIRLNSEADRTTLLNAINGMVYTGGATAIGDSIALAASNMDALLGSIAASEFDASFRKLIDVSTDGANNSGTAPSIATDAAHLAGYDQVNCLGIGAAADCTWNWASDLDFTATTFADVEAALRTKVGTELGTIPEPSTLALLGLGMLGFGAMRRRTA